MSAVDAKEYKETVVAEIQFLINFYMTHKDYETSWKDLVVGLQEALGVVEEEYINMGGN